MGVSWFTELADELAQALIDARACGDACEALLEAAHGRLGPEPERRLLATLVAPAAIARVLIDLMDRPPALLLACAHVCRETSLIAIGQLAELDLPLDPEPARAALAAAAESCRLLLEAAAR